MRPDCIFVVDCDNLSVTEQMLGLLHCGDRVFLFSNATSFSALRSRFRIGDDTTRASGFAIDLELPPDFPSTTVYVVPTLDQASDMAIAMFVGGLLRTAVHPIFVVSKDSHFQSVAYCANSDGQPHVVLLNHLDYGQPLSVIFFDPNGAFRDEVPDAHAVVNRRQIAEAANPSTLVPRCGDSRPNAADALLQSIESAIEAADTILDESSLASDVHDAQPNVLQALKASCKQMFEDNVDGDRRKPAKDIKELLNRSINRAIPNIAHYSQTSVERYVETMRTYVLPLCKSYVRMQANQLFLPKPTHAEEDIL